MQYSKDYTLRDSEGKYIKPLPPAATGWAPRVLQNAPSAGKPTIVIREDDGQSDGGRTDWEDAFRRWLDMMDPTDSKEWRQGVFLIFTR